MQHSEARDLVLNELRTMLRSRCGPESVHDQTQLRDLNFRSLDFAELALAVEERVGFELDLERGDLHRVETVGDVLAFFQAVLEAA